MWSMCSSMSSGSYRRSIRNKTIFRNRVFGSVSFFDFFKTIFTFLIYSVICKIYENVLIFLKISHAIISNHDLLNHDLNKKEPFNFTEYLNTKIKLTNQKETAEFHYALFSESGFDEKVMAEAEKETNVQLYTLSDIVNYKAVCQ